MANNRIHAFGDDCLQDDDAVGVAQRIRDGEITAKEATAAAISRAGQVDEQLNAIVVRDYERAVALSASPREGVFRGVPTFVKDNTDLKGLPTRHGALAVPDKPAATNGAFAKQLLALGVVPLGKSTLPPFGLNASTEFVDRLPTRNPWDLRFSCGASSGGAVALVAAGVVPIAHANDGGGSIRIPAACCGVVGIKPSYGRLVDSELCRGLPVKIVADGVVTRSVRDQAHFYLGAEQVYRNRRLPEIGFVEGPSKKRLRVGLLLDSTTGHLTDEETRTNVQGVADVLSQLGHHVDDVALTLSPRFADDFVLYWTMLAFAIRNQGSRLFGRGFDARKLDVYVHGLANHFRARIWRAPGMLLRLRRARAAYAKNFRELDLLLSPIVCHTTPELGFLHPDVPFDQLLQRLIRYAGFTALNNAAGTPAMSLPLGSTKEGLPVGIHFAARYGDERTLLEIAYELEAAQPFRRIQDGSR